MIGKIFGPKELRAALPYRYPILMLDRATAESETRFIGVKNLSINELFFQGHFPNHPIMPGVLQLEAMKQLAQLAISDKMRVGGEQEIYMKRVEKVKFRKPNNPGDRVWIVADLLEMDDQIAVFNCKTSNNVGVSCQAVITLAMRDLTGPEGMPEPYDHYDKSTDTVMDVTQIMSLVPHRYPFLLIDNIAKVDGDRVVAVKNVSMNEEMFAGFVQSNPTLPVALQCEIIAQAGCACVLSREENKGKIGYFMSIDFADALHPVYPGDRLICEIQVPSGKSRFGKGNGSIRVGNTTVMESSLTFAIVDP